MWGKGILILLILISLYLSIRQRMVLRKKRKVFDQLPDEPIKTLFSEALAQLVGVAGGIYLSLIMLVSFLGLDLPEKVTIAGISMQPLALLALLLAILQPLWMTLFDKLKDRKQG
ncbi:MAG TPA: hypothetical protein GX711_10480 [Clostridia bacterium]|jgi:Ni,Fe-hydrogenase III small subunit|nr:hypothetical protein [Clostridia bacterium]